MPPAKNRNIPATRWQPELLTRQRLVLMSSGFLEQHDVLHMPVRLISRARQEKSRAVKRDEYSLYCLFLSLLNLLREGSKNEVYR